MAKFRPVQKDLRAFPLSVFPFLSLLQTIDAVFGYVPAGGSVSSSSTLLIIRNASHL